MVSFIKFIGLSLAAFSAVSADATTSSVPAVRPTRDANYGVCGCPTQDFANILYRAEDIISDAANLAARIIDSNKPDGHKDIVAVVQNVTETINGVLNYAHSGFCVDTGIIQLIENVLTVQFTLIKTLISSISILPLHLVKALFDLVFLAVTLVKTIFVNINLQKEMKCLVCADVETLNKIGASIHDVVVKIVPNAPALPPLTC